MQPGPVKALSSRTQVLKPGELLPQYADFGYVATVNHRESYLDNITCAHEKILSIESRRNYDLRLARAPLTPPSHTQESYQEPPSLDGQPPPAIPISSLHPSTMPAAKSGASATLWRWHNPPTALEEVPDNIVIRHAVNKSLDELPRGHPDSIHKPTAPKGPTSSAIGTPSAVTPVPNTSGTVAFVASTNEPPAVASNPADYGDAKTVTHHKNFAFNQKVEAQKAITDAVKSTIIVVIWLESNVEPARLSVVPKHAGHLVLRDQVSVTQKLGAATSVSVFRLMPHPEWTEQELDVPIPVSHPLRVLCRMPTLRDRDCSDLSAELDLFGVAPSKVARNVLSAPRIMYNSLPTPVNAASISATGHALSLSPPLPHMEPSHPLPFPRVYVHEMVAGFRMLDIYLKAGRSREESFSMAFEGSKFVYKTYNKHYKIFLRATGNSEDNDKILDKYKGEYDRWRDVVHEVKTRVQLRHGVLSKTAATSHQPANENTLVKSEGAADNFHHNHSFVGNTPDAPIDFTTSDGESHEPNVNGMLQSSVILKVTIHDFEMVDNHLTSVWTTETEDLNLYMSRTPTFHCATKQISLGLIHGQDVYAIKTIILPGEWWSQWASSESATWVEASRLALCALAAEEFLRLAANTGPSLIHPFKVLPTQLFALKDHYWIGQSWIRGTNQELTSESANFLRKTLEAFSHYTYQASSGTVVHTAFQYRSTQTGVVIYNCSSHASVEAKESAGIGPFLRSNGHLDVLNFASNHLCNSICLALGFTII
ncbi:hypothetical protein EYR36_009178 [Pleurotus pulmonarius]|nr:hypothetical protein EYR36_009178 [Pleurotus pulmonarius]